MSKKGEKPLSSCGKYPGRKQLLSLILVDSGVPGDTLNKALRKLEGAASVRTTTAADFFREEGSADGFALILVDPSWAPEASWEEMLCGGSLPPYAILAERMTAKLRSRLSSYDSWGILSLKAGAEETAAAVGAMARKIEKIGNFAEERKVLLRELHHRVKNNFQLIVSMLHLKMDGVKDEEALARLSDFRNYLMTMARIHERLYRSPKFPRIDLNEILQDLLRDLIASLAVDLTRIELRLRLERIFLPLDAAVPIAIILNELITNVFKHAFPPEYGGRGVLVIRASRRGEETGEIVIEDNGVGLSGTFLFSSAPTLGFTILRALVKQAAGLLRYENAGSGARFILTVPLGGPL